MPKCPICKGSGNLEKSFYNKYDKEIPKKKVCKLLRKEGYSIRQIMRFLGFKSPRSISNYLKKSISTPKEPL